MKVAIVSDAYLPQINGVSRTLNRMKEYMDRNGIDYKFIVPGNYTSSSHEDSIFSFQSLRLFLYPECMLALPLYSDFKAMLDDYEPDLIHLTSPFTLGLMGLKYCCDTGVPMVSSYHTDFPAYLKHYNVPFLEKPLWQFFTWFHSFSLLNFAPSIATKEQMEQNGIKNVEIWSRGIDFSKFSPNYRSNEIREKYSDGKIPLLLYVGRIAPEKELGMLMETAKLLNKNKVNFKLLMVGDGPSRPQLEAMNIPNVVFAGYKSGDELSKYYASCDVFVFPSSTETYGNVVPEAMASGLPVVSVNAGGVMENLIHMKTGLGCNPGDSKEMAKNILSILENDILRHTLINNALAHVEKRTWKAVFDDLFDKFRGVTEMHGNYSNLKITG